MLLQLCDRQISEHFFSLGSSALDSFFFVLFLFVNFDFVSAYRIETV